MAGNVLAKETVLDYLWVYSHFYSIRLHECEELYRKNHGYAAVFMLFSCLEIISKSVANDYDSSSFAIYQKLHNQGIFSEAEYNFLNTDEFSLRKIRNLFAHANIAAINLVVDEQGEEVLWPLTEDDTALLLYKLISGLVFNLILKIVSSTFFEEVSVKFQISLDKCINSGKLKFKTLTTKELLVQKGFPKNYISEDLNIPEDAKIRLIENASDVNMYNYIFENIASIAEDKVNHQ